MHLVMRVTLVSGLFLINSELEVPSQQMMILAGRGLGLAAVVDVAGSGGWRASCFDAMMTPPGSLGMSEIDYTSSR